MKKSGNLWIIIIILFAVILLSNIDFTSFSLFATTTSCVDSDGQDIYTKGNVNGVYDYCLSTTRVIEMYCDAGVRKAVIFTCPTGSNCLDGKCSGGTTSLTTPTTTPTTTVDTCSYYGDVKNAKCLDSTTQKYEMCLGSPLKWTDITYMCPPGKVCENALCVDQTITPSTQPTVTPYNCNLDFTSSPFSNGINQYSSAFSIFNNMFSITSAGKSKIIVGESTTYRFKQQINQGCSRPFVRVFWEGPEYNFKDYYLTKNNLYTEMRPNTCSNKLATVDFSVNHNIGKEGKWDFIVQVMCSPSNLYSFTPLDTRISTTTDTYSITVGSEVITINPSCGDGVKNTNSEQCDRTDLAGKTCASYGYSQGTLKCGSSCIIDTSGCLNPTTPTTPTTYCGDKLIQKPNTNGIHEVCDGTNMIITSCTELNKGYTSGVLKCRADCTGYDESGCSGGTLACNNNGVVDLLSEDCDGNDFNDLTCSNVLGKSATGNLVCKDCKLDSSNCEAIEKQETLTCSDGTLYGSCSSSSPGKECVDGTLKISAYCCSLQGQTIDLDKEICVDLDTCNPSTEEITCSGGVEYTCNSLPGGTGIWRQTKTCEQEYCKLSQGCVLPIIEDNEEGEGVEIDPCVLDSCSEGCDRTHLPKVCGLNTATKEFKLYTNKCSLTSGIIYAGNEQYCEDKTGGLDISSGLLIGVGVLFVIVVILGIGTASLKRG